MLPHHNGEVAMPRRWKTLIFLTALLATTLELCLAAAVIEGDLHSARKAAEL